MENKFHSFRENSGLNMPNPFIFVDTETKSKRVNNKTEKQKFYLGWAIFWDRILNIKEYKYFTTLKSFWEWFIEKSMQYDKILFYAHNMEFDFKMLNGYHYLINKYHYKVKNFYIENKTFIIRLENEKHFIEILDTYNYMPSSLQKIGNNLGIEKQKINFNKCSDKKLSDYCKNDCEIIYSLIKSLIEFLEENNLTKLMSTSAGLSLNAFRHKFYDRKDNKILIHNWHSAISLERDSYSGGISDCFKIGEFKETLFKVDINSMYPKQMKDNKLPIKLLFSGNINDYNFEKLYDIFKSNNDKYLCIADCDIYLPKKYAYILTKAKLKEGVKSIFLSGYFRCCLTTPELNFVLKYGKILKLYRLNIYEGSIIFKDFVDFFYTKKQEFKNKGNLIYSEFCKLMLNSLYGKFAQRQGNFTLVKTLKNSCVKSDIYYDGIQDKEIIKIQMGNNVFEVSDSNKNTFDSFVAISSFVTAYARMYLIDMLLLAKRENVYYTDTDCLIVNQEGLDNLQPLIDNNKLGLLKLEGISHKTIIYKSKDYVFNDEIKCKGVTKKAILLSENHNERVYKQKQFEKFRTSLSKNHLKNQYVYDVIKHINNKYDKGMIINNVIEPYYLNKGV